MTPRVIVAFTIAAGAVFAARAAALDGGQLDPMSASWRGHPVAVLGHGGTVCGPFEAYAPDGEMLVRVDAGTCVGSTK